MPPGWPHQLQGGGKRGSFRQYAGPGTADGEPGRPSQASDPWGLGHFRLRYAPGPDGLRGHGRAGGLPAGEDHGGQQRGAAFLGRGRSAWCGGDCGYGFCCYGPRQPGENEAHWRLELCLLGSGLRLLDGLPATAGDDAVAGRLPGGLLHLPQGGSEAPAPGGQPGRYALPSVHVK